MNTLFVDGVRQQSVPHSAGTFNVPSPLKFELGGSPSLDFLLYKLEINQGSNSMIN